METKKVLQIITLKPDLVKDQNELNTYIQKWEDYKKELAKIDIVNDDNIETAKNLKSSITTAKTDIEKARKMLKAPILEIGKAIDSRAKELEKPFIEMQGEIKAKIDKYNEAEEKQKEIERQRIEGIIEKIKSFENLEELTKYYKSLEVKDQRKKLIADAGAVRKKEIVELEEKRELENFKKEIAEIKTTEDLQKVLLNPEDPKATEKQEIILNRKNAIKIEVLEKEKEELLKKDQEKKEKEKSKTITDFYKKCGLTKDNQENYHIEETEREIKIFKLVDTLILTEGKAMEGMI